MKYKTSNEEHAITIGNIVSLGQKVKNEWGKTHLDIFETE